MAIEPAIVPTPAGVWTKIGSNLTSAFFIPAEKGQYFWSFRLAGNVAPTDKSEVAPLPAKGASVNPDVALDIYVWSVAAGSVRIDGNNKFADVFQVHIDLENVNDINRMVIDMSDGGGANWKHPAGAGEIILKSTTINVNPAGGFMGDIELGFLSNVDSSNGDFTIVKAWHIERVTVEQINIFTEHSECNLSLARLFGPKTLNDVAFQTDVNLVGPNGGNHPSGDGDLVLRVFDTDERGVDIGLSVCYKIV